MANELRNGSFSLAGPDVVTAGSTLRLVAPATPEPTPAASSSPTVRVVSSSRLTREALADSLARRTGFIVDASAPEWLATQRRTSGAQDIIVLDHATDGGIMVDLIAAARRGAPTSDMVVVGVDDRDVIGTLIDAGVRAFVLQGAAPGELVAVIGALSAETPALRIDVPATLMAQSPSDDADAPDPRLSREVQLTPRERQVIQLIVDGMCNKEIATTLGVAIHTVKSHVHSVLQKMSVGSRLALAALVRRQADRRALLAMPAAPDGGMPDVRLTR
ncbi:MAG: HTH-type transcriptional regulator MalT [Gemmatimonadaceae bacterium]|nr:HTH-type transcriptional regulator MalT [Gemmatimonadaceae bacterium]